MTDRELEAKRQQILDGDCTPVKDMPDLLNKIIELLRSHQERYAANAKSLTFFGDQQEVWATVANDIQSILASVAQCRAAQSGKESGDAPECPYPILDDRSASACIAAGKCGCVYGAGWQPISTAPRDGTPIEVCNTRHPDFPPVIVRWTTVDPEDTEPDQHWCDAATLDGTALYYNQNYFDFWKPTTPLPSTMRETP